MNPTPIATSRSSRAPVPPPMPTTTSTYSSPPSAASPNECYLIARQASLGHHPVPSYLPGQASSGHPPVSHHLPHLLGVSSRALHTHRLSCLIEETKSKVKDKRLRN